MKRDLRHTLGWLHKKHLIIFVVVFMVIGGVTALLSYADVISNPTHIIDVQWNYPFGGGENYSLTSISTDMTPKLDGSPDGYFYAANFYFSGATVGPPADRLGYMGLQDEGNDGNGHIIAKTASITIYGATSGAAASGITETCGNPSGEGQQCNLRDVYTWIPGHTYRFILFLQTADNGNGSEIWTAQFADVTTNTTVPFGTLNVPTSWKFLGHAIITFHERFTGPTASCSDITPSFVAFSNVTANSGSLAATASSSFSSGVNQSKCPGFLYNNVLGNTVYSGYGPNISSFISSTGPTGAPTSTNNTATIKTSTSTAPTAAASKTQAPTSSGTPTVPSSGTVKPAIGQLPVKNTKTHHNLGWLYILVGLLMVGGICLGLVGHAFLTGRLKHFAHKSAHNIDMPSPIPPPTQEFTGSIVTNNIPEQGATSPRDHPGITSQQFTNHEPGSIIHPQDKQPDP